MTSALEMECDQCTFWNDSINVLCWVSARSRSFKPFIAYLVGEMKSTSNPKQWCHVPTELKSGEIISRGVSF